MKIGYVDQTDTGQWKCIYFNNGVKIGERLFSSKEQANHSLFNEWVGIVEEKNTSNEYPISDSTAIYKNK